MGPRLYRVAILHVYKHYLKSWFLDKDTAGHARIEDHPICWMMQGYCSALVNMELVVMEASLHMNSTRELVLQSRWLL